MNIDSLKRKLAIAIMQNCEGGDENTPGDAGGNEYRWQDYLDCADAVIDVIDELKDTDE